MMWGLADSFGRGPSEPVNTLSDGIVGYSGFIAPLCQRQGDAFDRYVAIVRPIVLLLFHRRPAAVSRLIPTMILNPIYGMFWRRAFAHVFQKCAVITPPLAYRPGIIMPVCQVAPNPICPGFTASLAVAVLGPLYILRHNLFSVIPRCFKAFSVHILHQTAARARIAKNKPVSRGGKYLSAIAVTFPQFVMGLIHAQAAQRCKSSELLSCQIFRCAHDWY